VVKPSYSVACAVLCAGLTLLGFITTSTLAGCGTGPQPADMAEDDDVETGRPASKKAASVKKQSSARAASASASPAASAPAGAEPTAAAGGQEMKELQ
jgi:hypothetical protein